MATKLKEVDAVIVGLGWTGGILAKELTEAGLKVVALERGAMRSPEQDFAVPIVRDELRFVVRHDLMQNTARDTLTIRNNPSQDALPMRRLGSFLPGEVVGGSAVHWSGHTWRWTDMEFKVRSMYEERYGRNFIPAEMTVQDWGITYAELEPYYDKFEYTAAVSGKVAILTAKSCRAATRSRRRAPASIRCRRLRRSWQARCSRRLPRTTAITHFRDRRPMRHAPIPILTDRNSAPANIVATASVSAARQMRKGAR